MAEAHSFGALVRRRRKALDLTQAALAQQVGCAESLICKIESEERRPSRQVAERLANALHFGPEERDLFVKVARGERAAERLVRHDQPFSAPWVQPYARQLSPALPAPLTPLVGREAELLALDALLTDPASRLVTIVAPGGMGKTRLAIAAAARQQGAACFPDGVFFLDLTPIERPARVATALAALFGLPPDSAGHGVRPAEQQLLSYLRTKRLLLVLDNAEHLLDAVSLFTAILQAAPGVVLLVTSRERLQVQGEQRFPLAGLTVPADPAPAAYSEATSLFLQVARRASPTWAPSAEDQGAIAAICRLLGGMPLAIELAGAWAAVLAPAAILAELRRRLDLLATGMRDMPERQRSLQALFDAIWQQMRPEPRAVFARLAVFRDGFAYQAAAGVAGASMRDLADLAAAALLSYDPDRQRYRLHELLRQYAADRLVQDAAAQAAVLDAHAGFFCTYAAQLVPELWGARQRATRVALEAEQENISAAWQRAVQQRRIDILEASAHALGLFYMLRADTVRGAAAFDEQVAALGEDASVGRLLRARLLSWRSAFLRPLGHLHQAERLARRALELLGEGQEASDTWRAAEAHARVNLALAIDNPLGAQAEYELALRGYRALGRAWEESYVLHHIAGLYCDLGQLGAAMRAGQASLALRESCGDPRAVAHTLQLLSRICVARGQLDDALALASRCYATFEQLDDRAGVAKGLRQLGMVLYWHGRFAEALPLAEQSLAISSHLGLSSEIGAPHALIGLICAALGQGQRAEEAARAAAAAHQQQSGALAEDYHALGFALLVQGRDEEAQAAFRESVAQRDLPGRSALPEAAPLLALCLGLRGAGQQARRMLAGALRAAYEQRAFTSLIIGLAVAAPLLAGAGETARAVEIGALANSFACIANNRGLQARLQPGRETAPARPRPAGAAGRRHKRSIWEAARRLAVLLVGDDAGVGA